MPSRCLCCGTNKEAKLSEQDKDGSNHSDWAHATIDDDQVCEIAAQEITGVKKSERPEAQADFMSRTASRVCRDHDAELDQFAQNLDREDDAGDHPIVVRMDGNDTLALSVASALHLGPNTHSIQRVPVTQPVEKDEQVSISNSTAETTALSERPSSALDPIINRRDVNMRKVLRRAASVLEDTSQTGWMFKRSGRLRFGSRWQRRWFILDGKDLNYSKFKDAPLKGSIDLSECTVLSEFLESETMQEEPQQEQEEWYLGQCAKGVAATLEEGFNRRNAGVKTDPVERQSIIEREYIINVTETKPSGRCYAFSCENQKDFGTWLTSLQNAASRSQAVKRNPHLRLVEIFAQLEKATGVQQLRAFALAWLREVNRQAQRHRGCLRRIHDILHEFRQTEANYDQDLMILCKVFFPALRELPSWRDTQIEGELETMATVAEEIMRLHTHMAVEMRATLDHILEIHVKQGQPGANTAGCILKKAYREQFSSSFSTFMGDAERHYRQYIERIPAMRMYAAEAADAKKALREASHFNSKCRGLSFTAFVIVPLQRTCQYHAFFERLSKTLKSYRHSMANLPLKYEWNRQEEIDRYEDLANQMLSFVEQNNNAAMHYTQIRRLQLSIRNAERSNRWCQDGQWVQFQVPAIDSAAQLFFLRDRLLVCFPCDTELQARSLTQYNLEQEFSYGELNISEESALRKSGSGILSIKCTEEDAQGAAYRCKVTEDDKTWILRRDWERMPMLGDTEAPLWVDTLERGRTIHNCENEIEQAFSEISSPRPKMLPGARLRPEQASELPEEQEQNRLSDVWADCVLAEPDMDQDMEMSSPHSGSMNEKVHKMWVSCCHRTE